MFMAWWLGPLVQNTEKYLQRDCLAFKGIRSIPVPLVNHVREADLHTSFSALRASAAVLAIAAGAGGAPGFAKEAQLDYALTAYQMEPSIGAVLKGALMGPLPDGTPIAALYAPVAASAAMSAAEAVEPVPVPIVMQAAAPVQAIELPPAPVAPVAVPSAPAPAALPAALVVAAVQAAVAAAPAPAPVATPASTPAPTAMTASAAPAAAPVDAAVAPDSPAPHAAPDPALAEAIADVDKPVSAEPPAGATESLRDAIVAALKENPEIQIALARQDDARYGVDEARAGYLPHVDLQAGWGREEAKSGTAKATRAFRSEVSVTMSQNVWDFGVTINDIKRARASYMSSKWATREQIEGIAYDITNSYLGVLAQQQLFSLTEQEIAATKKILRIVTVQKDLGLTTPADVGRAQTRLENVQSQLLDRKSALEQSRNAYKRLTNHLPAQVVDLPPGGTTLPESADAAVELMDSHSPRLAQAVQDRRSLDKQYDSQTGSFFPRIGVMVQGNYKNDVQGLTGRAEDARAMVTLSYKLFNGGADRATRRRIGARLREADYELDRRRREVEQDIRIDYEALTAARQKIATIDAEIESATRVAELYRQQFREGRRTVFDLLDSEQVLFAARANRVNNGIAMRAAEYRVLQKLGGLFDLVSGGEALPPLTMPAPGADD